MATAAITGTITESVTEADIVSGGRTIQIELTGDVWIAAGSSLAAFSDDFNRGDSDSLGANWTETGGDIDIASNTLSFVAGSYAAMLAVHNTPCNTVSQYVKVKMTSSLTYLGALLRYTNSSSDYYLIAATGGTNFGWFSYTSLGAGEVQQGADTSLAGWGNPESIGVTITGTGTNTVVRVWRNPTANAPDAGGTTWDSSAAGITWTSDPSNAVDTGNYIGLGGSQSSGPTAMDDFFGGDIP
jgi:hypothetical protein